MLTRTDVVAEARSYGAKPAQCMNVGELVGYLQTKDPAAEVQLNGDWPTLVDKGGLIEIENWDRAQIVEAHFCPGTRC
jgi:hypothetical protein